MKSKFDCSLKLRLHTHLLALLEERIHLAKELVQSATDARNEDTKSSAGDKYETGRAMMQQQIDMNQVELHKAELLFNTLKALDPVMPGERISAGSLIYTNIGIYYIAVGIGKIDFEEQEIFVVSPAAPLAQMLMSKKQNDQIHFTGKDHTVLCIC
jgi:transcription elongation GreA/GreB family factor